MVVRDRGRDETLRLLESLGKTRDRVLKSEISALRRRLAKWPAAKESKKNASAAAKKQAKKDYAKKAANQAKKKKKAKKQALKKTGSGKSSKSK